MSDTPADADENLPRSEGVRTLEHLAEQVLSEKAASGEYPVRFDHCFERIAYDVAVGAKWDTEMTPPFYQHATPRTDPPRRGSAS